VTQLSFAEPLEEVTQLSAEPLEEVTQLSSAEPLEEVTQLSSAEPLVFIFKDVLAYLMPSSAPLRICLQFDGAVSDVDHIALND
jgi:hypothetical protein